MDRELKFRVWDKYSGKSPTGGMHYFDAMEICDNGLFFRNSKFDLEQNHNDDESAVVMQYTGLKDKNCKEIYEGDILHSISLLQEPVLSVVEWDSAEAKFHGTALYNKKWIGGRHGAGSYRATDMFIHCEVVGNIFENEDILLKA